MTAVAAWVAVVVLAALGTLQVLVASGRPHGRLVWGGQHESLPLRLRIGSAIAVPAYAVIGWVLLARADVLGGPGSFVAVAAWVLVAYFAAGIALNGISRSRAERLVMTPACLVLTTCALVVATS
jgi:hypothetical protein